MTLAVSTAITDITPSVGLPMGGYGTDTDPRLSTGTRAALHARCVILWDNGWPNAIISLDLLGLPRALHQNIRTQLLPLAGWLSSDIIITTTHTHGGPALPGEALDPGIAYNLTDTTAIDAYATSLVTQVVGCVQAALAATQTACTLDYQTTSQTWSSNREGLPYTETAVPVLVARSSTGIPRVALFGYGCHSVTAGLQTLWDGDYPGGACAEIESALPGCTALFIPGPAGDQDPPGGRGWALRDTLSTQLGQAVATAAQTAGRTLSGPISTSLTEVELPLDITDAPPNLAAVRACYVARASNPAELAWYRRHAVAMIAAIDGHDFAMTVPLPIQVWRLVGSPMLRICLTGGELVSGYGAYFRNRFGGANELIIGSYANECPAYIPSNELLPPIRSGGSYAGGWDTDYPGIAGGSMTVYPHLGRFLAGSSGVESTLINAITAQLG
ncbi:MAG: hypothetical protein HKP61_22915 [Dactylosporangium sp.]|nr:hypothetical protein [Dactylosporangium sp.]NNJ63730.1 hypothetical protein [Dactylosporangium sp.]